MVCNTARSTSFTWKGSHLMGDRVNTSQFISPRGALFVVATSTCQRMKREDTPEGQRTARGQRVPLAASPREEDAAGTSARVGPPRSGPMPRAVRCALTSTAPRGSSSSPTSLLEFVPSVRKVAVV